MAPTAYDEGLPVVADPGILSPQAFVDELFNDRFPNEYLGDTNLHHKQSYVPFSSYLHLY